MVQSLSMILTWESLPSLSPSKYHKTLVAFLSLVTLTMFASMKTGANALHFSDHVSIAGLPKSQPVLGVQMNLCMLVKSLITLQLSTSHRF